MLRLWLDFCKFTWRLSYRVYGYQYPAIPTVGSFWTRLALLPLLMAFLPIYWLSICGWPLGLLALACMGIIRDTNLAVPITYISLGTIVVTWFLYLISRPRHRLEKSDLPQVYHAVGWVFRLGAELGRRYMRTFETPLNF